MRKIIASLLLIVLLVPFAPPAWAQTKIRVNWTATAAGQSGLWVAHEEGLFKRHGLDVELLHIPSSSRAIQTMLAGEIAISAADVFNTVQAKLKGADVVIIAGLYNRLPFSLMGRPEFKTVSDLKGRKIGITRVGSATHTATLLVFGRAGLRPADYQMLPLVEVPNILTAMIAGQVDAGMLSAPTNTRARKAGFHDILDLLKEGPEYPTIALATTTSFVKANEDVVRRVLRGYSEAVHLIKTNKPVALRALQKYTKVTDPEVLEDAYRQNYDPLENIPYVSRGGLVTMLGELAAEDPMARQAKPEDVLEMRFVAELEKEGFFKKLWGQR